MGNLFDAIVPRLPGWSVIPAAAILVFFIGWPTLQEIWKEIVPSYRMYTREKMRLELLKLLYEVETLKKEHQLGDMESSLPPRFRRIVIRDNSAELLPDEQSHLSSLEAIIFGMIGGTVVGLASAYVRLAEYLRIVSSEIGLAFVAASLVGVIIYGILGAITAYSTRPTTRIDAAIRGAVAPLAIILASTIFAGSSNSTLHVV